MFYHELNIEERIQIQLGQLQGLSQRAIARMLERNPSTINRELHRNAMGALKYSASQAQLKGQSQCFCRRNFGRAQHRLLDVGQVA